MSLPYRMQDASTPGSMIPGFQAVAGYIGGDTPHVWTAEEWGRFKGVPKLPIYVRSTPGDRAQGNSDGWDCLQHLFKLRVPKGKAVAYDIETDESVSKVLGFREIVEWGGYVVWLYGSRSTVFKVPAENYWVADYTGSPHWPSRNSRACQYAADQKTASGTWDYSCIRWWQVRRGKLWT